MESPPTSPSPDDQPTAAGQTTEESGRKLRFEIPLWVALLIMTGAVILAAIILARVAGPLYGLLFPFDPPVPDGAHELEHIKPDKGAEYWIYRTEMSGREVATFYEEHNGQCWYTAAVETVQPDLESTGPHRIAQCTGSRESAGLTTSWEVFIAEGYSAEEGPTVFRIYKFSEVE